MGNAHTRCKALLLVLCLIAASTASGTAAVRIEQDYAGRIGTYIHRFEQLRQSRQHVIVDGDCLSACPRLTPASQRQPAKVTAS